VALENCLAADQSLTFDFRSSDGSTRFTRTVTPVSNGSFSLYDVLPGNYTVHIKGGKWLAENVAVDATNGDVSGVDVFLRGGDANDDNVVNVDDLAALIVAFDADPTYPNWNDGVADFDCNDIVDVDDLHILILNFDRQGDP
jgi:hypothetical protein